MAPLFPLFLKVEGERCLVVGGGKIAADKVRALLRSGAHVEVVAERIGEQIEQLAEERSGELLPGQGTVIVRQRPFLDGDVRGARLVIAATNDEDVNRRVAGIARELRVLVNVVDVVPLCDFYTGGIVERGPLQVVIGTSGASPSLARRMRLLLEERLPQGLGALGRALGRARPQLLHRYPSFKERAKVLDRFVTDKVARIEEGDDGEAAELWIEQELMRD